MFHRPISGILTLTFKNKVHSFEQQVICCARKLCTYEFLNSNQKETETEKIAMKELSGIAWVVSTQDMGTPPAAEHVAVQTSCSAPLSAPHLNKSMEEVAFANAH